MQKSTKRLLSLFLALAMSLGMTPATSLTVRAAASVTTWAELQAAFNAGGDIVLGGDITPLASTDDGYDANVDGSFLNIPGGVTVNLDLAGYAIDRALEAKIDGGLVIRNNGTLTIDDSSLEKTGKITGGRSSGFGGSDIRYGGGILNNGALTLNGGSVTGNIGSIGGGVYDMGTFTMNGGSVTNNTTSHQGAGILLGNQGKTFTMNGGVISGNKSEGTGGGGVYVGQGSTFIMNDGTITGNTSKGGAGVCVANFGAKFYLKGGSITNNTDAVQNYYRGGICVDGGSSSSTSFMYISGNPVVSGNMRNGAETNIYLKEYAKVICDGQLSFASPIGIYKEKTPADGSPVVLVENLRGKGTSSDFTLEGGYAGYFKKLNTKGHLVVATTSDVDVVFKYNGDDANTSDQTVTVSQGSTVTAPDDPTRANCVFTGWFEDGSSTPFDFNTALTDDVALTAYWEGRAVGSVDPNGGSGEPIQFADVLPGTQVRLPGNAFGAPEGKLFNGWKADGDDTVYQPGSSYKLVYDTVFKAVWVDAADAAIDPNGAEGEVTVFASVLPGESIRLPDNPFTAPAGKVFNGWKADGDDTVYQPDSWYKITDDIVFKAVWADAAEATLDPNGAEGEAILYTSVLPGTSIKLPGNSFTAPEGYAFYGWKTDDSDTVYREGADYTLNESVTFKAIWVSLDDVDVFTFSLKDSYGDGWNGNAIGIYDAETGELVDTVTLDSGSDAEVSVMLRKNEAYDFKWVRGSYPDETSFSVRDGLGEFYAAADGSTLSDGQILFSCPLDYKYAYAAPGGAEGEVTVFGQVMAGKQVTLPDNIFTVPDGIVLKGWKLGDTVYRSGQIVTLTEDATFTAVWADDASFKAYSFDDGLGDWTTIDADGDGHDWLTRLSFNQTYDEYKEKDLSDWNRNNHESIVSGSYIDGIGALSPDNWLVSPRVKLGGSISFSAKTLKSEKFSEHIGVFVSTSGNTDPADFEEVQSWTLTADSYNNWVDYEVDLGAYSGMGYVAIRHYDCSDMYIAVLNDIVVVAPHDLTYSAEGAVITASCSDEECGLNDSKVELIINAPEKTDPDDDKSPNATLTGQFVFNTVTGCEASEADIVYIGRDGTDYAESTTAPTVGAYTARITVNGVTAGVDYQIKYTPAVEAPAAKTLTFTGSAQELVNAGTVEGGTMYYALGTDAETVPADDSFAETIPEAVDAGTYYVWYKAAGDETHLDTEPQCVEAYVGPAFTVTYKVANGTWADGTEEDKTELVAAGEKPANVPVGMTAASGFTGGAWDEDPEAAVITEEKTFTYTFEEAVPYDTFTDVTDKNSWYYEAVYWAVKNGVTSGMGEGTFQPMARLTRAQAVQFLYNLAGKPDVSSLPEVEFPDVEKNAWYYDGVRWAVANKITSGYGIGTFQPNVPCTRAMTVALLANYAKVAGTYKEPSTVSYFWDVAPNAWYKKSVDWAVENGITSGYGLGTFQPNVICNRAMMVSFLRKVADLPKA